MKFYQFKIGMIFLLTLACSSSTDSGEKLNFEDLNIEYSKSGGWINHTSLKIDSAGFVKAVIHFHATWETLDSNTTTLTSTEKKNLCDMFESFKELKNYYEPNHYYTDQDYHVIILKTEAGNDTTSVYDPAHCILPNDLNRILNFMDQKIDDLLFDHTSAK